MPEPKSTIRMASKNKVGTIDIEGSIGWDYWDDGISYNSFKKALNDLGDVNIIELRIKSPGGVVTDGVGMMNLLDEHPATIHTYNMAEAGSMASAMLLAGDKVHIPDNAMTFIHKPLNIAIGNADVMRKTADELDKFEKALTNSYMKNFKGDEAGMSDLLATETWYTADEIADKFDNVVIIKTGEQKAAATSDPVEILGDIVQFKETALDKVVNKVRNKVQGNPTKEVDMPITAEEKQELMDGVQAIVTASIDALKEDLKPKDEEPETPEAKVEVPFEGDMDKPEDVEAHAKKLARAKAKAEVDWNDQASVNKYLASLKESDKGTTPASAQIEDISVSGKISSGPSKEDVSDTIARMSK